MRACRAEKRRAEDLRSSKRVSVGIGEGEREPFFSFVRLIKEPTPEAFASETPTSREVHL